MKLSSVRVATDDVATLAAFYARITGTTPVGASDYTELATSGATLALCSREALVAASPGAAGSGRVAAAPTDSSVILEFEVDDLDAVREHLRDGGGVREWVQEPTDQPWGNRSMLLRDPDGNLVNVFTPIAGADRGWPSQAPSGG
ncbi:VOC family protein [Actinomycetospora chlora]|uniref:VOC family protein n=1 Tax=Actinomycetospora chlora TaxID=663608 RepID=A0ABP9C2I4_9PSEU